MSLIVFCLVLPWLLVGLGCWLAYQLIAQSGRIVLRLEAVEQQVRRLGAALAQESGAAPGLAVGSPAPEFELPDLAGGRQALGQYRGRRVLLVFFNPECGHCRRLAPQLAALPPSGGDGRPLPLVLTTGDAEDNRRLVQEHGLRCPMLLQERTEVADRYEIHGTPTGYLIDEHGAIASELATGGEALLALARARAPGLPDQAGPGAAGNGHAPHRARGKANRGLATSRLNRNGLKAGTPAPPFRLPRLDGGELALEDYRGRRVLLIFSNPDCGPCRQLAPRLEEFHCRRPDMCVLMVSRRDAETNREKVAEWGLTLPVVLQRHWEVSLLYGMFATPIAYLIDEQGIIAADVAQGSEAILALMAGAATRALAQAGAPSPGKEVVPMRD
jgi:peroxiredoxin